MKNTIIIIVLIIISGGVIFAGYHSDGFWRQPTIKEQEKNNDWDEGVCSGNVAGIASEYLFLWKDCCMRHDNCYTHGEATYRYSRTHCDNEVYNCWANKCNKLLLVPNAYLDCNLAAYAVRALFDQGVAEDHFVHVTDEVGDEPMSQNDYNGDQGSNCYNYEKRKTSPCACGGIPVQWCEDSILY